MNQRRVKEVPVLRSGVLVAALAVALLTTGCTSLGPNKLQDSHVSYNKAVQKAIMEEDFLNVVRLRYLDMPVSLSVSSIAAQTTLTVGTLGEFGLVEGESSANILPNISYSDRPTITFTPAQGQEFLESLAQPIPLETLVRLAATHSGIDVLMRVVLSSINGIANRFDTASSEFDRLAGVQAPDLSDLFTVRVSSKRPEEPGIAVQYRDHWFFIPDSDHVSKRTFGLMKALFLSLILKDPGQGAPVLTIPLNLR